MNNPNVDDCMITPVDNTQVGKHLLAYGADVNTANKAGDKPRNVSC